MNRRSTPPGWPRSVPPPVGDEWIADAVAWLLDQGPPEFRGYPVLRRHPPLLAAMIAWHLQGARSANRLALSRIRNELDGLGAGPIAEAVAMLEAESARWELLERAVHAVRVAIDTSV